MVDGYERVYLAAQRAELAYGRRLRGVANYIGKLIHPFHPITAKSSPRVKALLDKYSDLLHPWASAAASRMISEVNRRNIKAWEAHSTAMGRQLRIDINSTPVGQSMQSSLNRQVDLITSLPREAGERVQALATEARYADSSRFDQIASMLRDTENVTKARANLIARTEVARTGSELTQARARDVGSEAYIWRTAEDEDVRPLHRKLADTVHRWDEPPVAGERGERAHPGCIYNCRCYPEPVIPGFNSD